MYFFHVFFGHIWCYHNYCAFFNERNLNEIFQAWAVDRWISGGAPRNKLIMGLTSSATSFTLTNKTLTDVGSPVDGPGKQGPYLGSAGHVTYYRV